MRDEGDGEMTEEQIERRVEKRTDAVDRDFMAGRLSQTEYDAAMRELTAWADREYRFRDR
jgi:hypothetical protein